MREGDRIAIAIDRARLEGSIDLVVEGSAEAGAHELTLRSMPADLAADPALPPETRLWAALQDVSGGTWGGCVFDVDRIVDKLQR